MSEKPTFRNAGERQEFSEDRKGIEHYLRESSYYLGVEARQQYQRNRTYQVFVDALPETLPDGSIRWLPEGSEAARRDAYEEFTEREQEFRELLSKITEEARDAHSAMEQLKVAITKSAPSSPALSVLEDKFAANIEEVLKRLDAVSKKRREVVRAFLNDPAGPQTNQKFIDAFKTAPTVIPLGPYTIILPTSRPFIDDALASLDPTATFGAQEADRMLTAIEKDEVSQLSQELSFALTDAERTTISDTLNETTEAIRVKNREIEGHILKKFPERSEYLNKLAGDVSGEEIVAYAQIDDERVDLQLLLLHLEAKSRKTVDPDARDALELLVGDPPHTLTIGQKEELVRQLNAILHVKNPTGISVPQLLKRSLLPVDLVSEMETLGLKDIHLSGLCMLAEIGGLKKEWTGGEAIGSAVAGHIVNAVTETVTAENGEELLKLNVDALKDVLTVLKLERGKSLADAQRAADASWTVLKEYTTSGADGSIVIKDTVALRAALENETIANLSAEYANKMRSGVAHLPWTEITKNIIAKSAKLAGYGTDLWLDYIKSIPRNFAGDDDLLRMLNERRELQRHADSLQSVLDRADRSTALAEKAITDLDERNAERDEILRKFEASGMPKQHFEGAKDLHRTVLPLWKHLDEQHRISVLPRDVQVTALWIGLTKGKVAAEAYLRTGPSHSPAGILTDAERAALREFLVRQKMVEIVTGNDILKDMAHNLQIRIHRGAHEILRGNTDAAGVPLSEGPARMALWIMNPKDSEPALRKILTRTRAEPAEDDPVDALIQAFCHGTEADYSFFDSDGEHTEKLTPSEALTFVEVIREHLSRQQEDHAHSALQTQRKERFTSPLDVLRAGKDAVMGLLRSGDTAMQGLAVAMILAAGVTLRELWKQNGTGKKLMIALPMLLGADVLVKRMTERGVLDRLGLRYMSPEDRNTAYEQFFRRNEKQPEYAFMKTAAGQEAVRLLMDPNNTVTPKMLLAWRKKSQGGSFAGTADTAVLEGMASRVMAKMGTLDKRSMTRDARREKAYEYLYLAFDALCKDVAEANDLPSPTADRGAQLIHERWVEFTEGFMDRDVRDALQKTALRRPAGAFSMYDILIYERNTPAMREEVLADREFLEKAFDGTGIAIDWARQKVLEGWTYAKILGEHGKEYGKRNAEAYAELVTDGARTAYNWLRTTGENLGHELSDDEDAALRLAAKGLEGIAYLFKESPEALSALLAKGIDLTDDTFDALQGAYEVLLGIGLIGEPIELIDRVTFAATGNTMSQWMLYGRATATTGAALDSMEKKEDFEKEFSDFTQSLTGVVKGPIESAEWVNGAIASLNIVDSLAPTPELKTIEQCTPAERMLVLERIKRRVYSSLLDTRIDALTHAIEEKVIPVELNVQYPLSAKLGKWEELAQSQRAKDIEKHYGISVLLLLGNEPTQFIGALKEYYRQQPDGFLKSALSFVHKIASIPNRDYSREYLTVINTFVLQNMRRAREKFRGQPDERQKLNDYQSALETMVANAVIDMTLRKNDALGLPEDALHPSDYDGIPLLLTIDKAKNFGAFLTEKRGAVTDPNLIEGLLPGFRRSEEVQNDFNQIVEKLEAQKANIGDVPPGTFVPGDAPNNLEQLVRDPESAPENDAERKELAQALATNIEQKNKQDIIKRLDKGAEQLSITDGASLRSAFELGIGASNAGRSNIETKIKEYADNTKGESIAQVGDAQYLRELRKLAKTPEANINLQRMLDVFVARHLRRIVGEIQQEMKANPNVSNTQWKGELIQLYRMTAEQTDRLTDCVSFVLEFLLYRGDHASQENGKAYFEKYQAFLQSQTPPIVPPQASYYRYGRFRDGIFGAFGSAKRMNTKQPNPGNMSPGALEEVISRLDAIYPETK